MFFNSRIGISVEVEMRLSNVSNGFPKSQPNCLNLVLNEILEALELLSALEDEAIF